jgi:hypothetical protein
VSDGLGDLRHWSVRLSTGTTITSPTAENLWWRGRDFGLSPQGGGDDLCATFLDGCTKLVGCSSVPQQESVRTEALLHSNEMQSSFFFFLFFFFGE